MKINTKIISDLKPCRDRHVNWIEHYSDFDGDILDFLELDKITAEYKVWVAVRVMPRLLVEVFAIDCALSAYASAADAAAYASSAYAYACAASASAAAASASAAAADADYAAAYACAASASAADADYAAAYAASASARKQERENQIDALIMLIEGE